MSTHIDKDAIKNEAPTAAYQTNFSQGMFMNAVEEKIARVLGEELPAECEKPEILIEAARHLCLAKGAKRIRPRLVSLYGEAMEISPLELLDISVAAEMIHAASLLHDDVVDESNLRRGLETVNCKWGNKVAVLAGDLVLSLGFILLNKYVPDIHRTAVRVVDSMTRAAMLEVQARGRLDFKLDGWFFIAEGKTAKLFSWCGQAVGFYVGNEEVAARFEKCGKHLGIAFQMADDLRDLQGSDPGKERFSDIRNFNPSFPILKAASMDESLYREICENWKNPELDQEQVNKLGEAVLSTGVTELTIQALEREIEQAIDALGPYQNVPGTIEIVNWTKLLLGSVR
ncbi:polyprenyl synthetase family protein [Candidatus Uabimicrobium amorphum]|uniref:Octaprenyl diphosphate synthase n=1 Tax=Uabimicrobium amorphum TaxID=2596890 RepID=A0A5S9IPX3_UABAM|nr:polyprenyl synthetase family protein [Candidatus Uabimicrobium amorphum]BBM85456.1 octaprenyl diphosphate synthase [Candidatus Uabimicrobium amorphum]